MDNDSILVLRKFKLILTRSLSLFWLVPQRCSGKRNIFILTVRHNKFQCELWLPSWYFLTNFNIVFINRMGFSLISWNPGFEDEVELSLNFHRHWYRSTYLQYDILETLIPLPRSAVLHKIHFFHLDELRGSGLKKHISSRNKLFAFKLEGSTVGRLCLATGSWTLAHFWVGGFRFKYFAMWYEDV